jgi:D-alanyl-D-alanine dipeptidase
MLIFSCSDEESNKINSKTQSKSYRTNIKTKKLEKPDTFQYYDSLRDLIAISSLTKDVFIDLKYATDDNFMHQVLYDHKIQTVFLQIDVAKRLVKCQAFLSKIDSNLHLLLFDGLRPLSVQQKMWDALDTIPINERTKFVSNPKNGSVHNYGAAVDITICDSRSNQLDMGAGYDDIRLIAYPKYESEFLEKGELTIRQINNRKLLRKVLLSQGFKNITTEWWHFNACSREEAKKKYRLIQ